MECRLHVARIALTCYGVLVFFQPARACWATQEDKCIEQPGCSWFTINWGAHGCPLCGKLFGDQSAVTGCRDWDFFSFCNAQLASPAAAKYKAMGGDVTSAEFREAISHYELTHGWRDGAELVKKQAACNYWCDMSPPYTCQGQVRARNEIRGVNYGARFVPESYLHLPKYHDLVACVWVPPLTGSPEHSLCDVASYPDAGDRMKEYMDVNIKLEHFSRMKDDGFDTIRLPLGYWNLVDDVGAPDCPQSQFYPDGCPNSWRQRKLTSILPAKEYTTRIDRIFDFSQRNGIKVMLDFHSAPGGQTPNCNTGCAMSGAGFYFDTRSNKESAVRAIEAMAVICKRWGETCWGMELLNEPAGIGGPAAASEAHLDRWNLKAFYEQAILASRKHLPKEKPLVINEWACWLPWWQQNQAFNFLQHGRIVFSTHLYHIHQSVVDQAASRIAFRDDLDRVAKFYWNTKYDTMISEYSLSGHHLACSAHGFDYSSFLNWFVNQCNQHGLGSMLWNFDGHTDFWGPVEHGKIDGRAISWQWIFPQTPRTNVVRARNHSLTWPKDQTTWPTQCSRKQGSQQHQVVNTLSGIARSAAGGIAEPEAFADAAVGAIQHAAANWGHWRPRQLFVGICSAVGSVKAQQLTSWGKPPQQVASASVNATYRALVLQRAAQQKETRKQTDEKLTKEKLNEEALQESEQKRKELMLKKERHHHKLEKFGNAPGKSRERVHSTDNGKDRKVHMPDSYKEVFRKLRLFYSRNPVYT